MLIYVTTIMLDNLFPSGVEVYTRMFKQKPRAKIYPAQPEL